MFGFDMINDNIHDNHSLLFLLSLLLLLLLSFLLLVRGGLLLTAQFSNIFRPAFIIVIIFLLGLEIFILALVLISDIHHLGLLLLLHYHLHLSRLEVLNQRVELSSLHPEKLHDFLLLSEGDLDVELLVGCVDAMKLDCLDLLYAEVEDRFGNEDKRLFEHVQPTSLSLNVGFDAGLASAGLEVISRLDEVETSSGVDQLNKHLKLRTRVLRLQLLEVRIIILCLWTDLGLNINLNLLLDLDDNIPIHSLSLIYGLVLVELQYNGHL